jgi:outer membrane biosynthesis protein TonB
VRDGRNGRLNALLALAAPLALLLFALAAGSVSANDDKLAPSTGGPQGAVAADCHRQSECPSSSPTSTRTPTPTATPTPRPSVTPTPRPSATPTPRPSATPTPRPSAIPTPRPSSSPTRTPGVTPAPSATTHPTATPAPTATARPTATPRPAATPAPTRVGGGGSGDNPSGKPTPGEPGSGSGGGAVSSPTASAGSGGAGGANPGGSGGTIPAESAAPILAVDPGVDIGGSANVAGSGDTLVRASRAAPAGMPQLVWDNLFVLRQTSWSQLAMQLAPTIATVSAGGAAWAAFAIFGKKRRNGQPEPTDSMLAAAAATGVEADAAAGLHVVDESQMPRWRRPSLQQVRKQDPLRVVGEAPKLSFAAAGVRPLENYERRLIKYRLVRLLDSPDELRSTEIGVVDQGDEVQLLQRYGVYWLVLLPDGRQGWVHRMTLADPAQAEVPEEMAPEAEPYECLEVLPEYEAISEPEPCAAAEDPECDGLLEAYMNARRDQLRLISNEAAAAAMPVKPEMPVEPEPVAAAVEEPEWDPAADPRLEFLAIEAAQESARSAAELVAEAIARAASPVAFASAPSPAARVMGPAAPAFEPVAPAFEPAAPVVEPAAEIPIEAAEPVVEAIPPKQARSRRKAEAEAPDAPAPDAGFSSPVEVPPLASFVAEATLDAEPECADAQYSGRKTAGSRKAAAASRPGTKSRRPSK